MARWSKLPKQTSYEIKRLSGEYQLYNDYTQLTVTEKMSIIIGENGSGVYMGTILKGKPHGVGRFASDCNQSILEGQFREGHLYGYIREVF